MSDKVECPKAAKAAARNDSRIVEIAVYPDGWVTNKYGYRAPGRRVVFRRNGCNHWVQARVEPIDRKRSNGNGPTWVALSERGGTLASG